MHTHTHKHTGLERQAPVSVELAALNVPNSFNINYYSSFENVIYILYVLQRVWVCMWFCRRKLRTRLALRLRLRASFPYSVFIIVVPIRPKMFLQLCTTAEGASRPRQSCIMPLTRYFTPNAKYTVHMMPIREYNARRHLAIQHSHLCGFWFVISIFR